MISNIGAQKQKPWIKVVVLFLVLGGLVVAGFWIFASLNQKTRVVEEEPVQEIASDAVSNATTTVATVPTTDATVNNVPSEPIEPITPKIKPVKLVVPASDSQLSGQQAVDKPIDELDDGEAENQRFVVALDGGDIGQVADDLVAQGFVSDKTAFISAFGAKTGETVTPGGYKLSKGISLPQIVKVLRGKPYMEWIVIPEGLRKEEIAQLLVDTLGWTAEQRDKWINTYTAMKFDYVEGVYFPDTYLIPVDEDPLKVAERLQAKFNEKFAVYLPEFNQQNIKWTTGLTFASVVQREAANKEDMPLIAGILWNRIEAGMALNVDATLQYVRGDTGNGWWAPLTLADKQLVSPYNTYLNKGLPPHPICNPGISAIEATLHPTKTDCLYYLHDSSHVTHCAVTYEDHQANIEKYLKN